MDPFTLALATFGVQKLRGKSTKRALRDAALIGGGSYALGASGIGPASFQNAPLSSIGLGGAQPATPMPKGNLGTSFLNKANMPEDTVIGVDKFGKDIVSRGGELSGLNVVEATEKKGIAANLLEKAKKSPFQTAILASSVLPLLEDEEVVDPPFTEEDYTKAYAEQSDKLQGASKTDHDENDYNNYVRAEGYVEDGAGNGDKDEDTMLAQLADGEFVSRADAVLGAGILSGGDPKSYKSMRKAGADFFYDQQKKLKRIYDLVDANTKDN